MKSKSLSKAYERSHPLDGRPIKCCSLEEWENLKYANKKRDKDLDFNKRFVKTLRAAVETIFPGAKKANVNIYILRSLRNVYQNDVITYKQGLKKLEVLSQKHYNSSFKKLNRKNRQSIMEQVEGTEFFETLRQHTMEGMFADPIYGGNKDKAGWKLIGFPGARFHPITHLSRGWKPKRYASLKDKGNGVE
ncbi:gluconate 2-dehydrogenase subunit 3 family protein [Evansella halocellulosilytica]|uniref:gluconate 2-dehydrogenase subunit 3 family protein n=1 Tax=Evansella halocellulosilytica TaxID=2011013 RepID=UPI000BB8313B|nr:gluconate 2-dehydrogenase subunit 3 family protein [Evansella halocellulosilytica]